MIRGKTQGESPFGDAEYRAVMITLSAPPTKQGKRKRDSDSSRGTPVQDALNSSEVLTEDGESLLELAKVDEGQCPICSARLPIASIPMHIERGCPPPKSGSSSKADWKKVFGGVSTAKTKE